MNPLLTLIHHPLTGRVGWVVLHSLWQAALIGIGFALVRASLRRHSPEARYLAGCVALLIILISLAITSLRVCSWVDLKSATAAEQVQLSPPPRVLSDFPTPPSFLAGRGWGLGTSVVLDGPWAGAIGWDGGLGTSFLVHPARDLTCVVLTQRLFDSPQPPAVHADLQAAALAASG